MLSDIKCQQDSKFELLNNTLLAILSQNKHIQKSVEALSSQQEQLLSKVALLEQENSEYKTRVSSLEDKVELLERNARCTTLEIRNLPKLKDEGKDVLINTMINLNSTINPGQPLHETEIKNIFRNKVNTVVIDFTTVLRKENIIRRFKFFNKTKRENKELALNSQHLKLPGAPQTIFVFEYLTGKARHLFYLAREHVKTGKLFATWTSSGRIYVKKEEGSSPVHVAKEPELNNMVL